MASSSRRCEIRKLAVDVETPENANCRLLGEQHGRTHLGQCQIETVGARVIQRTAPVLRPGEQRASRHQFAGQDFERKSDMANGFLCNL
jgi:hypothetical protein